MYGRIRGVLKYEQSTISFLKFGKGKRLLIAMHGYAENANSFEVLASSLAEEYIVIAIDLPFHGATIWKKKKFTRKDLREIIHLIMKMEGKQQFELMGFSLGGRLVLALLDYFGTELEKLWLIAPDGLENRWVDSVMKVPNIIRNLLYQLVQQPQWIIKFAELLHRWSLITPFVPKFLARELSSASNRDRAFGIWASLDECPVDQMIQLKSKLATRNIPVNLFFGKRDTIIPLHLGKDLKEGMKNLDLYILEGGHNLLNLMLNKYLLKHKIVEKKCPD